MTPPTLDEVLRSPDSLILRDGALLKVLLREYRRLYDDQPCWCSAKMPEYIRRVRLKHKIRI